MMNKEAIRRKIIESDDTCEETFFVSVTEESKEMTKEIGEEMGYTFVEFDSDSEGDYIVFKK